MGWGVWGWVGGFGGVLRSLGMGWGREVKIQWFGGVWVKFWW